MAHEISGLVLRTRSIRAAYKSPSQEIAEDEGDEKAETAFYPAQEKGPGTQKNQVEDIQQKAEEGKKNRYFFVLRHG